MSITTYRELLQHLGHDIECVRYGNENAALECNTCHEVLMSFDNDEFEGSNEEYAQMRANAPDHSYDSNGKGYTL